MDQTTTESIHRIWDRLAEIPVSRSGNEALKYLLESISTLIDADHAYWLSALRMEHIDGESDAMKGWRPGPAFYFRERQDDRKTYDRVVKEYNDNPAAPKESTLNLLHRAGVVQATVTTTSHGKSAIHFSWWPRSTRMSRPTSVSID